MVYFSVEALHEESVWSSQLHVVGRAGHSIRGQVTTGALPIVPVMIAKISMLEGSDAIATGRGGH